jgi:hypothetical protein
MELLALLAALQIGDAYSTLRFLKHGVKEANPIMLWLFEQIEPLPALIVTKIIIIAVAVSAKGAPYWTEAMLILCAFYAFIVVNNWKIVK